MNRVKDTLSNFIKIALLKIKEFFSDKKRRRVCIVIAVLLMIDIILGIISRHIIGLMPEQNEAKRWSDDDQVAQVSLFFSEDQVITENTIKRLVYDIDKKLVDIGVTSGDDEDDESKDSISSKEIVDTVPITDSNDQSGEGAKSGTGDTKGTGADDTNGIASLYRTCYSAQGYVDISFENKTAERVKTIGIGGDFFLFHPLTLVNGSYISGDDLMKDGIVIDEELAWNLFGSVDVVGQQVTIGDIPHYVKGVVKRPDGRMARAAGLDTSFEYISYDSLSMYGTILSGRLTSGSEGESNAGSVQGGINCFEIVCPSPVEGIAATVVKECCGLDDPYITVIDNSRRFDALSLAQIAGKFGTRSMWDKAIFYPYWENLARGYEDILTMILVIRFLCVVTILIILSVVIVRLYMHKKWTVRGVIKRLSDIKYDYDVKKNQKKISKEEEVL